MESPEGSTLFDDNYDAITRVISTWQTLHTISKEHRNNTLYIVFLSLIYLATRYVGKKVLKISLCTVCPLNFIHMQTRNAQK